MKQKQLIPDPEKKLAVIRRYLHILALLQNNKDPMNWNGTTLCEILQYEENAFNITMTEKSIRDYINKNLKEELGIDIDVEKGARRIELKSIPKDMLEEIINLYSVFVVKDSTKDFIFKNFIRKHPYDCLWTLARIHFASLSRNSIEFDYIDNAGKKSAKCEMNPYHILLRNNNLYLYGRKPDQDEPWLFILNRVSNIRVLDRTFEDDIPEFEEIFKDTLGSFIGKKYNIIIEFTKDVQNPVEQFLSIVEPRITLLSGGEKFRAEFKASDTEYLCKQLLTYGKNVEIIQPKEIRNMLVDMLKESLAVYEK
jgi:hypothetical protein